MSEKTTNWTARGQRKLRVVFVEDAFWGYVDLPTKAGAQQVFERQLRGTTGGTVSLYKPGSSYRDSETPPLTTGNLHVFELDAETASSEIAVAGESDTGIGSTPHPPSKKPSMGQPPGNLGNACLFSNWWQALAAIPTSKSEVDFWAHPDNRATIYDRLRRVWFDTTRNSWFYRSDQEDHLTATLWENFNLFHPSQSLPALFAAAGLPEISQVKDVCWSYEFEEHCGGKLKQIDVTLHFRDLDGDGLLIVEAKRPRGPLKATDGDPGYYLDLPSFHFTKRRYMIYLIDERDLQQVRGTVKQSEANYGFFTWQGLEQLQRSLSQKLDVPGPIRDLVADMIYWQFAKHGLSSRDPQTALHETSSSPKTRFRRALGLPTDQSEGVGDFAEIVAGVRRLGLPVQVCRWLIGMLQHQAAWAGATPIPAGFEYLDSEPTLADIIPGMPGRQRMAERRVSLWKLP